jgi:hypothetical protein
LCILLVECCEQHFTFVLAIITDVWRGEEGISTSEARHTTTVTGLVYYFTFCVEPRQILNR